MIIGQMAKNIGVLSIYRKSPRKLTLLLRTRLFLLCYWNLNPCLYPDLDPRPGLSPGPGPGPGPGTGPGPGPGYYMVPELVPDPVPGQC